MIISTFMRSLYCGVQGNMLARVFDDLPVFIAMLNDLFDSRVLSYALCPSIRKEIGHVGELFHIHVYLVARKMSKN